MNATDESPIVRLPSGSCFFTRLGAPWFSKSATKISRHGQNETTRRLTFAADGDQYQTTGLLDVGLNEALHEPDIALVSSAARADDQALSNVYKLPLETGQRKQSVPGRSQKERSATSGPSM